MDKTCVACEKILPLDKFSKNARKNKDVAVGTSSAAETLSDDATEMHQLYPALGRSRGRPSRCGNGAENL